MYPEAYLPSCTFVDRFLFKREIDPRNYTEQPENFVFFFSKGPKALEFLTLELILVAVGPYLLVHSPPVSYFKST